MKISQIIDNVNKVDKNKNKLLKKKEIKRLKKTKSLDLFITGTKTRNIHKESQILSKTFNKVSTNNLKMIDINKKKLNPDRKPKNLQEKTKFSHRDSSMTIYNKIIVDEDYLKEVCRNLLKNKNKITCFKLKIEEIRPKFAKTRKNFNSLTKHGNLKSISFIDFDQNNPQKNIEDELSADQKRKRQNNFRSIVLKKDNILKCVKIKKEKSVNMGIIKQNLISKVEMIKITKFKVKILNKFRTILF